MSTQLNVINDTLNLLRGKTVRFILEDVDLRMIRNLVDMIDEIDVVYDQEKMIYVDPHQKTRSQLAAEDNQEWLDEEAARLERNRKAREKYHANKNKKKQGRLRKAA